MKRSTAEVSVQGIGFYVHVPFCRHLCPYCDFYKMELRDRPARARLDFPGQVQREMELLLAVYPELEGRPLETVYFGGGTPSTLVPEAVGALLSWWLAAFPRSPGPEITLEANPENLTENRARKWHDAGITRLSIGAQSFHPRELELLERLHVRETIVEAVHRSRRAGFANLSLDLMFGLPGQTLERWMENLRRAVDLGPDHVSFYGLTWHEGTPFEAQRRRGRLVELDDGLQADMYLGGAEFLVANGFEHYEISNFARPGCRSRHNARYWTGQDVIGLGPGAHSRDGEERWRNPEDLDGWASALAAGQLPRTSVERPGMLEAAWERLFTGLRRAEGLRVREDPELTAVCRKWREANLPEAARWMEAGPDTVRLTREGWLLSDAILGGLILDLPADTPHSSLQ